MLSCEGLDIRQDGFRLRADWSLPKGVRAAVIGPSGAGKSTLLGAIAGFVPSSAGRVLWEGVDMGPLEPGARPLTMLFQDYNLFPHLSVAQNVGLGLSPGLHLSAAQWRDVEAALDRVGLDGLGARLPGQVSGGQAGRVALARALLRRRPMLLLDEPFAALGPGLKAEMLVLVAEITGETGATLLMVTHDPRDAERVADLTIHVEDGLAAAPVPTAELLADPPPGLARYLGV